MLVEEGGAAVDVVDRWHATPLDNARDLGAAQLVEYLEPLYEEVRKVRRGRALRPVCAWPGLDAIMYMDAAADAATCVWYGKPWVQATRARTHTHTHMRARRAHA